MISTMGLALKHGMIIQSNIKETFNKEKRQEKEDLNLMAIGMKEISLMANSMGKVRIILVILESNIQVNLLKIILLA